MTGQLLPNVLWAQRKDKVFLTVEVANCDKPDIKIDNEGGTGHVSVKVMAGPADARAEYAVDLVLHKGINDKECKIKVDPRKIFLVLDKAGGPGPHWPRLLAAPGKAPRNVKADWGLWKDEDEEEEEAKEDKFDLGDLDNFRSFADEDMMGGSDSDDEDLPDLEK